MNYEVHKVFGKGKLELDTEQLVLQMNKRAGGDKK
jgi:hypothetical protein